MRIGVHLTAAQAAGGPRLAELAQRAEAAGLHSVWPMDQATLPAALGDPATALAEPYAALAWMAAHTTTLELGVLVTSLPRRQPALLAQAVTTLDELSGGRAWLGLGATGADGSDYDGLERALDALGPVLRERRVPLLIGGGGERRTLPLVARRADACNLFERVGEAALERKLGVLRDCCAATGRAEETLVRTTFGALGTAEPERFERLAALGVDLALVDVPADWTATGLDRVGALADRVRGLERDLREHIASW